jgi:hypothetical protein
VSPGPARPWERAPHWKIHDRYLEAGRLRLRSMTDIASGEQIFKLCKKFSSDSAYCQPIVNIYLSREEYESLRVLPAHALEKRRFRDSFEGRTFSIDVFGAELEGLVLCEIEATSLDELMAIEFPPYARIEVTQDRSFTGGALCRTSAVELARRLQDMWPAP